MQYNFPGSIVISYLGGTFGNALASMITASQTGIVQLPVHNIFHVANWPYEYIDCTITKHNVIRFNKNIVPGDIVQLHCLNAELVSYKFPSSQCILLTCQPTDEYFGIQRQWLVNKSTQGITVNDILSAWDWIIYNLTYYNQSSRVLTHPHVLCLDFKSVVDNINIIEEYLKIKISDHAMQVYKEHIANQMSVFYNKDTSFNFAWTTFNQSGPTAPIEDLAKEFVK